MKSRIAFGLAATLALAAGLVIAQPEKGKAPVQPELTPEQQVQMDAWTKAATPGEFHKHLAQFAGEWDGTIKHRQDAAAPWQESATSCRATMEWKGRYLRSKWKGDMMGQEFHGEGVWAYNNVTKQFQGTWIDNMNTGISSSTGLCDSAGKVFTFNGEMDDPMTGKKTKMREVWTVEPNAFSAKFYGPDQTGKEFHMMEINVKRKGASTGGNPAAAN